MKEEKLYYLGISCWYHDSSATLICNGDIISAVQEERFSRVKQDSVFPEKAIKYCLKEAKITLSEVTKIVFYDDPNLKFKRIKKTYLTFFPKSIKFFIKTFPIWFFKKQFWKNNLRKEFKEHFNIDVPSNKITNCLHHRSHAASAFFPSKFQNAAVLILDGVGEFDTTTLWSAENNKIVKLESVEFPHSIGLLYSAMTSYIGFKVNSGEYKVMGLAPYGKPKYVDLIKKYLINIQDTGNFKLNMDYFDFATSTSMTNQKLHRLFGKEPRLPETEITQFEMDIACSIQQVTEEVVIKLSRWIKKLTGKKNLCLAGGVALNCVGNGKILLEEIFEKIWVQPAAGDAGCSLGAALDYHYRFNERSINYSEMDAMKGTYLGPKYENREIEDYLKSVNAQYEKFNNFDTLIDIVTDKMIDGNVIGWHQDRMEYGPRSLGNRSILGDPRNVKMQAKMNLKIKYRESFRPFAPSIINEKVKDWFEIDVHSPYMLFVAQINSRKKIELTKEEKKLFGIDKLNVPKSTIPAVTHVDYSARVQTVHKETNPKYYSLIQKFNDKTGCPVVINTSFNVRGEPIVCSPEDSYRCFMRTEMDLLVIGDYVLYKRNQPNYTDKKNWKEEFKLD